MRIRGTKNTWLTAIDKGEITAYRAPEVRALASRKVMKKIEDSSYEYFYPAVEKR